MFGLGGVPCFGCGSQEAVIKSAASAASRKTKSRGPRSGQADGGRPGRFPGSWSSGFGFPGGCASSRLDNGFQIPSRTHACQPLSGPCGIEILYPREWRIAISASLMRVESEVGGKRVCKDRAPQPGGRFVPSVRAARSVIHVESGMKRLSSRLPFSLLVSGHLFPFSLQDLSAGFCLSKSEQIGMNLSESE